MDLSIIPPHQRILLTHPYFALRRFHPSVHEFRFFDPSPHPQIPGVLKGTYSNSLVEGSMIKYKLALPILLLSELSCDDGTVCTLCVVRLSLAPY